jgi:putative DNA-invertase from lambdoid prophage Rac
LHDAGRLQLHILSALAEFERGRIIERVRAGLDRRKAQGKPLGRPRQTISPADLERTRHLSTRKAAAVLGVSHAAVNRARLSQKPSELTAEKRPEQQPEREAMTV